MFFSLGSRRKLSSSVAFLAHCQRDDELPLSDPVSSPSVRMGQPSDLSTHQHVQGIANIPSGLLMIVDGRSVDAVIAPAT